MRFGYNFSNLCGTVYQCGNILFTPSGNEIISAVGSRVTVFNIVKHTSVTLPFESRALIKRMAMTPNGRLLLTIDEDGHSLCVDFAHRTVLYRFNFKKTPEAVEFSPNGKYFAITLGKKIQIWFTPGKDRVFAPYVLHQTFTGHHDNVLSLNWSPDSTRLVTGSADLSVKVYMIRPPPKHPSKNILLIQDDRSSSSNNNNDNSNNSNNVNNDQEYNNNNNLYSTTLAGHRGQVVACFFTSSGRGITSVASDGAVFEWIEESQEIIKRLPSIDGMEVDADADDDDGNNSDVLTRWKLDEKHYIQQDHAKITSANMVNAKNLLLVGFSSGVFGLYEMPGVTNIYTLSISQHKINTVAISPTSDWLAFGAKDLGQLLVWEWQSETYVLKQQGHYYNVNCVAFSPDGQLVATGGDDAKVKVWNTSSGFCFVTFNEHKAPVKAMEFACGETGSAIITASLDGTVRAFDLARYRNFRTMRPPEPCQLLSLAIDGGGEVVCAGAMEPYEIYTWSLRTGKLLDVLTGHNGPVCSLAFSPLQPILASSSWDKSVRVWEPYKSTTPIETFPHRSEVLAVSFRPDAKELCSTTLDGTICMWDVENGTPTGTIDARRDVRNPTSLCYSADGTCILVSSGQNSNVCIYSIEQKVLIKRYTMTHRKNATMRSQSVRFSPTGHSWAAATSEGLMVYSLNEQPFTPVALSEAATPQRVRSLLNKKKYGQALVLSMHLNDSIIVREAFEAVPVENIQVVAKSIPAGFLQRLLDLISVALADTPHIEFYLNWINTLMNGNIVTVQTPQFMRTLRGLKRAVNSHQNDLKEVCDENQYMMSYAMSLSTLVVGEDDSSSSSRVQTK
jgi:periodic tryptophan protein 2